MKRVYKLLRSLTATSPLSLLSERAVLAISRTTDRGVAALLKDLFAIRRINACALHPSIGWARSAVSKISWPTSYAVMRRIGKLRRQAAHADWREP